MITFDEIRKISSKIPLEDLVANYVYRQNQNAKEDEQQFNIFLEKLNKQLTSQKFYIFHKTVTSEILLNIDKEKYDKDLVKYFYLLLELTKPKITDYDILTSLEWQMQQAIKPSTSEFSYDHKFEILFRVMFEKFDLSVQKQFLKLLKRYNYNSSMDLLVLMTCANEFYNKKIDLDHLKRDINILTSVNGIKNSCLTNLVFDTSYGSIHFSLASEALDIEDTSLLTLGNCHFAVSEFLKKFPNLYGAYYYIPNYFRGFIEHSVLIDYDKNYVYDLSHNTVLPLDFFNKYYNNVSFVIAGKEFNKLRYFVKHEYGSTLYMHHIEEVKRQLRSKV